MRVHNLYIIIMSPGQQVCAARSTGVDAKFKFFFRFANKEVMYRVCARYCYICQWKLNYYHLTDVLLGGTTRRIYATRRHGGAAPD